MKLLYHYTSIDGLLGMLKDCSKDNPYITMWATHSMFLNDPTEYKCGKDVCKRALLEVEDELEIDENKRISKSLYNDKKIKSNELSDFIYSTIPEKIEWGFPYIISLSRSRDSLPMWNTYAHKGQGIALGFNKYSLQKESDIDIKDCCYDDISDKKFVQLYTEIKEQFRKLYGNWDNVVETNLQELIYASNDLKLRDYYLVIKHKGYKYERETRCFATKKKNEESKDVILYRNSNNMIVPYIERKINISCLNEIFIGPCANKDRMKYSLTMLLKDKVKDLERINIESSDIPYLG